MAHFYSLTAPAVSVPALPSAAAHRNIYPLQLETESLSTKERQMIWEAVVLICSVQSVREKAESESISCSKDRISFNGTRV